MRNSVDPDHRSAAKPITYRPINYDLSLASDIAFVIYQDRSGTLWVGTTEGLNRFASSNGRFRDYSNDPQHDTSLNSNGIISLYEDSGASFCVGTAFGGNDLDRAIGRSTRFLCDRVP